MTKKQVIQLINNYWKFDNDQDNLSSWHDKQDLISEIEKLTIPVVVKSFYCLDEVHRGKEDVCQRQCEYCRKNNKQ